MRCPECKKISFDHLEYCRNCGKDLKDISKTLGSFMKPSPDLNWFNIIRPENSAKIITTTPPPLPGSGPQEPIDLPQIDIEDHVDDFGNIDMDAKANDIDDLEKIGQDGDFQQALDKVL